MQHVGIFQEEHFLCLTSLVRKFFFPLTPFKDHFRAYQQKFSRERTLKQHLQAITVFYEPKSAQKNSFFENNDFYQAFTINDFSSKNRCFKKWLARFFLRIWLVFEHFGRNWTSNESLIVSIMPRCFLFQDSQKCLS